jgi:TRAP-type uncharacterized transport system substrate-binding protein
VLGFNRWHLLTGLAAILCIAGIVSLALIYFFPAPPSTITIASGFKGGNYEILAGLYKKVLARNHVNLEMHPGSGGWDNVKLLLDQNSGVQTAFVQGGMGGSEQAPGLLSLGRINYQIFFIFYRAAEMLEDLTDLRGKRIAAGTVGTGSRAVIERILGISGVASENSTLLPLSGQAAFNAVNDGRADAAIIGLESDSPLIHSLLRDSRLRLMSVTRAEALTRFFPFLTRLVLPQGAIDFEKKIPANDVVLFANTNSVLVCDDLHPAHVRLLAQALVETHNKPGLFQRAGEFPTQTNSEYPMAEGAVDFYRNGPPLLNRYLPFWIVPHVLRLFAVLLAGGAIVYPLFNLAPKLYRWFLQDRLRKLYRRLRIVEDASQTELTAPQVVSLQTELEGIDRAARILPHRHSDLFFILEQHIILTRTQLASRLVEVRSHIAKVVQGATP